MAGMNSRRRDRPDITWPPPPPKPGVLERPCPVASDGVHRLVLVEGRRRGQGDRVVCQACGSVKRLPRPEGRSSGL